MKVGEKQTLTAEVQGVVDQTVRWTVNVGQGVATIDRDTGEVEAIAPGKVTFRATSFDPAFGGVNNYDISAEITVTAAPVSVTRVTLNTTALSIAPGGTGTLTATVEPNTADQTVTWRSSNTNVATVNNGVVSVNRNAAANSTATITAESTADRSKSASCTVTVSTTTVPVSGVTLNKNTLSLATGGSETLTATVAPDNASNKAVSWSSGTPGIAEVDQNGKVTAKTVGTAVITVTTADGGKTAQCTVTVTAPTVEELTISDKTLILKPGAFKTLTTTMKPLGAAPVTWSTSDEKIATVDNGGKVVAVAMGTATITASAGGRTATCAVTVPGIKVTPEQLKMNTSKSETVSVTTVPADGGTIRWTQKGTSVAKTESTNGRTLTLRGTKEGETTFTATFSYNSEEYTASCTANVSLTADTIYYTAERNEPITFDAAKFNEVCTDLTQTGLNYIEFSSLPSSSRGTLYYDYSSGRYNEKVTTSKKYYRNSSPYVSSITFVPKSGYTGTVSIDYTGRTNGSNEFTGTIVLRIGQSAAGDITYSCSPGKSVDFRVTDFNGFCREETGSNLDYVRFTLPGSSRGILYYNYSSSKTSNTRVEEDRRYYRSGSSNLINNISFVASRTYEGEVEIPFNGYNTDGDAVSGVVHINVGERGTGDITYKVSRGQSVTFDRDDFDNYCYDETGERVNYVRFTLPSSSRGTLYYNYRSSSSRVAASTNYYYSSSPYIDEITFVPASGYEGTVTIPFTGYSTDRDSFSGQVRILVGDTSGTEEITYSAAAGRTVSFDVADFNNFCIDDTGSNLNYVTFTLPSSSRGTLYYTNDSSSSRTRVSSNTRYYRNSSPYLDNVSFVPADNTVTSADVSFNGKATNGDNIDGTVHISFSTSGLNSGVIRYSTSGVPVDFSIQDFRDAYEVLRNSDTSATLSSVTFSLPYAAYGRLYSGYSGPANPGTAVQSGTSYYVSGSPYLSSVSFVPKADYTGTTTIRYTATDSSRRTYDGTIEITVSRAYSSAYFTDVGSGHSWAAGSIDFLHKTGVVNGIDGYRYGPDNNITRGDFVLMLHRSFNLGFAGASSFPDVPSGSYYATAIAAARQAGITTGSDDGNFHPNAALTRQDAMVLIYRTLNATGNGIAGGSSQNLGSFSDRGNVSGYAQSAVGALVREGVIQGSGGRINPASPLTRAEMAVILHRVVTR